MVVPFSLADTVVVESAGGIKVVVVPVARFVVE